MWGEKWETNTMVTELFYQGLWGHCDDFASEGFDHRSVTLLLKGLVECAGHGLSMPAV